MLRVIVVDDEAPARRYLLRLLGAHGNIAVVGEAGSRADAVRIIAEMSPDAVFMDIELGDGDGMDLCAGLVRPPRVIFVTAHADRAARAFDIAALDYLLKPVSPERLASAIDRLQRARQPHTTPGTPQDPGDEQTRAPLAIGDSVVLRSQGTTRVVKIDSISAITAKGDYVELRIAERTELMYITLTRLAERLPSPPFARLSRSLLLNLNHVATITAGDAQPAQAVFSTRAAPVDLGRVAANRLRKIFA